jgi:hypothetical protein
MCIPTLPEHMIGALCTGALAAYTALRATATFIFTVLSSIIAKVRMVSAPFFTPSDSAQNGSVGVKPFAQDIKILFVNGVGNTLETCRETAQALSQIFNNSLVHYTYLPLRYDQVIRSIMYGHRPSSCDLLLTNIKERLHELRTSVKRHSRFDQRVSTTAQLAIESTPRLLVFVHSGGGAMLEAIRAELTEEDRSDIAVYSFGSAHMFSEKEGFEKVKNAVAGGDPVPAICRLMDRRISPLGEAWTVGAPALFNIANHSILNDIYQLAMWHIRENYT